MKPLQQGQCNEVIPIKPWRQSHYNEIIGTSCCNEVISLKSKVITSKLLIRHHSNKIFATKWFERSPCNISLHKSYCTEAIATYFSKVNPIKPFQQNHGNEIIVTKLLLWNHWCVISARSLQWIHCIKVIPMKYCNEVLVMKSMQQNYCNKVSAKLLQQISESKLLQRRCCFKINATTSLQQKHYVKVILTK